MNIKRNRVNTKFLRNEITVTVIVPHLNDHLQIICSNEKKKEKENTVSMV